MVKVAYCAGHGRNTAGKRSPDGEREWFFNNKVALSFETEMKKYGNIELLRLDDPTGVRDVPLQERTDKAAAWGADICISFHHNAFEGKWGTHSGTETFYHRGSEEGYRLARTVHNQVREAYKLRDRGLKVNNLHITRETNKDGIPAILVEGGFMDSTIDIIKLRDDKVLETAGLRVAYGVLEYFNISIIEDNKTPILSKPTATVAQMQEWAKKKGAHQKFVDLAQVFYDESVKVGVNPVVTYTQSAKETGYFKFGGVLDASYKNPCGLKKTQGGGDYDASAHQRFETWEEGIRAQVDHLALYAGHKDYPKADTPDPRHFPYIRGVAPTVEDLGGRWAPSKSYGTDIVKMMKEVEGVKVENKQDDTKKDRYKVVVELDGYRTAADAKNRKNKASKVKTGEYHIFREYDNMINVTTHAALPGSWINPADNINKLKEEVVYKVRAGDTLSKIAKEFNTTVDELVKLNNLIKEGQELVITKNKYHKVVPGNTVLQLAKRYGSNIKDIKKWNGLDNNYTIYVGDTIRVK